MRKTFLVFALSICTITTSSYAAIFLEDFESGIGGFVIDNSFGDGNGLWHLSDSCQVSLPGHTQGAALYYGQDSSCDYDNGGSNQGVVVSPSINLTNYTTGAIELRFKYFLETEGLNAWQTDMASVEISQDMNPYTLMAHNYPRANSVVLTCPTIGWRECIIDLSVYAGSTIQLRFGFDTVDSFNNDYDGFYLDDIRLEVPEPCTLLLLGMGGVLIRKRKLKYKEITR